MMYFLYIDESGSNTSHFVLSGLAIPSVTWFEKSTQITPIKSRYGLEDKELHTGWMLRRYLEQEAIEDFETLGYSQRRAEVLNKRSATLNKLAILGNKKKVQKTKANYRKTLDYTHLSLTERKECIKEIADLIGSWEDVKLFAEAVNIQLYDRQESIFENAFTNVVSRFDAFLKNYGRHCCEDLYGLIIQDNNESQAIRLTELMKKFHSSGTVWTSQTRLIENPLFVDSRLTEMIQMVDLCSYATRRFFENQETDLFDRIYARFDKLPNGAVVGIRHYTGMFSCDCRVCRDHYIKIPSHR